MTGERLSPEAKAALGEAKTVMVPSPSPAKVPGRKYTGRQLLLAAGLSGLVGAVAGYAGRPLINPSNGAEAGQSALPTASASTMPSASASNSSPTPSSSSDVEINVPSDAGVDASADGGVKKSLRQELEEIAAKAPLNNLNNDSPTFQDGPMRPVAEWAGGHFASVPTNTPLTTFPNERVFFSYRAVNKNDQQRLSAYATTIDMPPRPLPSTFVSKHIVVIPAKPDTSGNLVNIVGVEGCSSDPQRNTIGVVNTTHTIKLHPCPDELIGTDMDIAAK